MCIIVKKHKNLQKSFKSALKWMKHLKKHKKNVAKFAHIKKKL